MINKDLEELENKVVYEAIFGHLNKKPTGKEMQLVGKSFFPNNPDKYLLDYDGLIIGRVIKDFIDEKHTVIFEPGIKTLI